MKIIINRDEKPYRIYHRLRNVSIRPRTGMIELYNSNDTFVEKLKLVSRSIRFEDNLEFDTANVIITLDVK